jgi:hypothetical protein
MNRSDIWGEKEMPNKHLIRDPEGALEVMKEMQGFNKI